MNIFALLAFIWCAYSQQNELVSLPLTLVRGTYKAVSPGQINYYKVTPCPASTAGNPWALLSIALPTNVLWEQNQPNVVVELSTCQNSFDSNCVFATNYIYGSSVFPQIAWQYALHLDTSGSFYMRVTAPIASVEYSFEIQFESEASPTAGIYNLKAFMKQTTVPSNAVFNRLMQIIGTEAVDTVLNFNTTDYFVEFCPQDFSSNCDPDSYTLVASVVSQTSMPYSGFNLYACPAAMGFCTYNNYELFDFLNAATGNPQLVINSAAFNTTGGVNFGIYGFGGASNRNNGFTFNVRMYC